MRTTVWFHHAIPFHRVRFGEILGSKPRSDADPFFVGAYEWLASEIGFWPLFLAVGRPGDVEMTGYQSNWTRFLGNQFVHRADGTTARRKVFTKKGQSPNIVLFSFHDVPGVFTDYDAWHIALNASGNEPPRQITPAEHRMIFKKTWPRAHWLRMAKEMPHRVQLVTPRLDLRNACRAWVRNMKTKDVLKAMGFRNVAVKRISVG